MFKHTVAFSLLALAGGAFADAISPSTYSAALDVGESVTIVKTVTVSAEPPTTALVDVFFLADETGSMGASIAAVKAGAASIMSSVAGLGDVQFAVGGYRDIPGGYSDGSAYRLLTDFTGNTTTVQTAINAYSASGGADLPEANLLGLQSAATGASWRAGSTRILVWFGDAAGHDPTVLGVTEASATAALVGANIAVQAVNTGNLNGTGQATRIATATGGTYYPAVNAGSIVTTITNAITTTIDDYSSVNLGVSGLGAGVGVAITPVGGYSGSWTRDVDRDFSFNVTFTGLVAGADENFSINALVDGAVVAVETDHITVGTAAVPEPGTMALMGLGLFALIGIGSRKHVSRRA
jgi:hypothetical protein